MNRNSTTRSECFRAIWTGAQRALVLSGCIFLLATTGCSGGQEKSASGVHRGHLIAVKGNDQMQLEIVSEAKEFVVYVWQTGTTEPYPVTVAELELAFTVSDREIPVRLQAKARESDPAGSASRFAASYDEIPQRLQEADDYTMKFTMEIDGATVTGAFDHKDDHSHAFPHD